MDFKKDFPIFKNNNEKYPLVYFDNASTTQKPQCVIDSITHFYSYYNANIHRGNYKIAEKATFEYENSRQTVANLINANKDEIIFTTGTTESINLLAYSFTNLIDDGDEIIISEMEHHSNILPWQMIKEKKNIKIRYISVREDGQLDLNQLKSFINKKTKLCSIISMSNILGTINDLNKISKLMQKNNIPLLVDAAQSIAHEKIDVKKINCDFLVFSGHKIMGPTGVGVLYMRKKFLNELPPFLRGGNMNKEVGYETSTWNEIPWKFEAGTSNIAQVIALKSSIEYVNKIGFDKIKTHNRKLTDYLLENLKNITDIKIYGHKNKNFGPIVSFNIIGCHPYDISKLLGEYNICIRAGHHCGQILMKRLNTNFTNRISLQYYNSFQEIDFFIESLKKVVKILKN